MFCFNRDLFIDINFHFIKCFIFIYLLNLDLDCFMIKNGLFVKLFMLGTEHVCRMKGGGNTNPIGVAKNYLD